MILKQYEPHFKRIEKHLQETMLLLGDQEYKSAYRFPVEVKTLDIQGEADYIEDLTYPYLLGKLGQFGTVFNLGTIEHIFDAARAWKNAALLVREGGVFVTHSPVAGWEGHGIHITNHRYIESFFLRNGFETIDSWFSYKEGPECHEPTRDCGRSVIFWMVAKKLKHTLEYVYPTDYCV